MSPPPLPAPTPGRKSRKVWIISGIGCLGLLILGGLTIVLAVIIGASETSRTKPVASELNGIHDSGFIQGEFDYGFTVSFKVTNKGESGAIEVIPWLSSSEGTWSRTQVLHIEGGRSMDLTYFFHEPTINSQNLQYGVRFK